MADERGTPLNQGTNKWLQITDGGKLQTWNGVDTPTPIIGDDPLVTKTELDDKASLSGSFANVKWFGAKGDGVADDTDSIQALLNDENISIVFFPKGIYMVSSSLDTTHDETLILGVGFGAEIKAIDENAEYGINNGLINIKHNNCIVKDILLDGQYDGVNTGSTNRSSGVVIYNNTRNCGINNVKVKNMTRHGFLIYGVDHTLNKLISKNTSRYGISFGGAELETQATKGVIASELIMEDSKFRSGIEINDGCQDIVIDGFYLKDNNQQGVFIRDHGNPNEDNSTITISNGIIDMKNKGVMGILIISPDQENFMSKIGISNIIIKNNINYGLGIRANSSEITVNGLQIYGKRGISLDSAQEDNTNDILISNFIISLSDSDENGVRWRRANDVILSNGIIENASGHGINFLSTSKRCLLSDVIIKNNGKVDGSGIFLDGFAEVKITNCYLIDTQEESTQKYGISSDGFAKLQILDNEFDGNNLGAINPVVFTNDGIFAERNKGFKTFNSGEASVPVDASFIEVDHELDITPSFDDFNVTPRNDLGSASKFWFGSVNDTRFRIFLDTNPTSKTADFVWSVNSKRV